MTNDKVVSELAEAIVAGIKMTDTPRRWLASYGGISVNKIDVPEGHKHLLADFKKTRDEMQSQVQPIKQNPNGDLLSLLDEIPNCRTDT